MEKFLILTEIILQLQVLSDLPQVQSILNPEAVHVHFLHLLCVLICHSGTTACICWIHTFSGMTAW
jgi:hypothetical protein